VFWQIGEIKPGLIFKTTYISLTIRIDKQLNDMKIISDIRSVK
jgi:hypothetical protein